MAIFALSGQCSGITRVISGAPSGRNICRRCPLPLVYATVLCFAAFVRLVYTGHGCGEANKRATDSKRGATGDNYPAHNRPIVGGR